MRGLSPILPIGSRCEEKIYLKKHIFEKTVFIVLLHICIAVGFFACSGRRETEETYGYVPAVRQVDAQGGVVRDAFLCGDELVYKVYYDGEGMQPARDDYYTLSLTEEDAEAVRIPFRFPAGRTRVADITGDDDGNYYILGNNEAFSGQETCGPGYFVGIYDAEGNALRIWGIDEWLEEAEMTNDSLSLAVDEEKNIYVAGRTVLLAMNPDGSFADTFTETAIYFIARMADGRVGYCCSAGLGRYQVKAVKPGTLQSETVISDSPIGISGIPGEDTPLWVFDRHGIYRHGEEGQAPEQILNWLDADVDVRDLTDMTRLSDGRLLLLLYDDRINEAAFMPEEGQPPRLVYLEQVENRDGGREIITVCVMNMTDGMREATMRYNLEHPQQRVRLKEYMGINGYATHEEAIAALDRDMAAGRDMDIITVGYAELEKYASKGILEDLLPFLDNSARLRREDVLKLVADTYTVDGKLVALPTWFRLEVITGRQSMVGDRDGWNLPEMMAFFERYQDGRTQESISPEDMLDICLKCYLPCFVDEENGTCAFEQDAFYEILEFAGGFDGKSSPYGWNDISREDGCILKWNWCVDVGYISEMPQWFDGEAVSYVGYPTPDGQSGILLDTSEGAYAILSKGKHRDLAWDYLEYLTWEEGERAEFFSILKDRLEENGNTAAREPYERDENGMIVTDREGNPVRRILTVDAFVGSDRKIERIIEKYVPLLEELEQLWDLIARIRPVPGYQEKVMSIIREEAAGYFAGDKDAGETARIIQSRVHIYLEEQK